MLAPVMFVRFLPRCLPLVVLLAACGSHHTASPPPIAARVGGHAITNTELQAYTRYASTFDSIVYPDSAEAGCLTSPGRPACTAFRAGVLARLIEERTVLDYAQSHQIRLSSADTVAAEAQMRQLTATSAPTSRLFRQGISRKFVSKIVRRQLLIQRVEERVVGDKARRGLEYRIRKIGLPTSGNAARDNRRLTQVAATGKLPGDAAERTLWMAPFKMKLDVRRALAEAQPGEYVGPFSRPGYLLLIQLVERAPHHYSADAHAIITSKLFSAWLARAVAAGNPRCAGPAGRLAPCRPEIMKNA